MAQHWVGSTDVNYMLTCIGGWHVGCENDHEARPAVEYAIGQGWVGTRMHYAPAFPEGVLAYELTDEGLDWILRKQGLSAFNDASRMRKWYRDQLLQQGRLERVADGQQPR